MKHFTWFLLLVVPFETFAQTPEFDFAQTVDFMSSSDDYAMIVADLDGDGVMECIYHRPATQELFSREYNGVDGFMDAEVIMVAVPTLLALEAADMDGDGDQDLITRNSGGQINIYLNNGSGVLGFPQEVDSGPATESEVKVADLDNDGDLDLVATSQAYTGQPGLQVFLNEGDGVNYSTVNVSYLTNHYRLAVGDMDGDGDVDVLASAYDDVLLFDNLGGGAFADPYVIISKDGFLTALVAADFDGDQDFDVFAGELNKDLYWYENTGDPAVYAAHFISFRSSFLYGALPADLDGDNDLDLVLIQSDNGAGLGYFLNKDGQGDFSGYFNLVDAGFLTVSDQIRLAAEDLNGDGAPELLFMESFGSVKFMQNLMRTGCMEEGSCNYDPEALIAGPCYEECGCSSLTAENDDGGDNNEACLYLAEGRVVHDLNQNGFVNPDEPPIVGHPVVLWPSGVTVYTDDMGVFSTLVPRGSQEFTAITTPEFNTPTTNDFGFNSNFITIQNNENLGLVGVEELSTLELSMETLGGSLCDAAEHYIVTLLNTGNTALSGQVHLTYDPLFQGHEEMTPFTAETGNALTWSYESLPPGGSRVFNVRLVTPTVDFIGEAFSHGVSATGELDLTEVTEANFTYASEVACAYDPNDKQVFPLGVGEEHRLTPGTTQEFLIRFQNTGNAPATDVIIRDTLDTHWDLASLEMLVTSHSAQITVDPASREMVFFFEDIQLPDSTCCEPDSHGMLSYRLRSLPETPAGTRIENTAYIFFDNNPAIVTNTTWTTIHVCHDPLAVTSDLEVECYGGRLTAEANWPLLDDWQEEVVWTLDGEVVGHALALDLPLNDAVEGNLVFEASNPLCEATEVIPVSFAPILPPLGCEGDLNCDAVVGASDVMLLIGHWDCGGSTCRYDLDGDLSSNSGDLLILLAGYGTVCD